MEKVELYLGEITSAHTENHTSAGLRVLVQRGLFIPLLLKGSVLPYATRLVVSRRTVSTSVVLKIRAAGVSSLIEWVFLS